MFYSCDRTYLCENASATLTRTSLLFLSYNFIIYTCIYFNCSYFVVLCPHELFMIFLSPIFYSMAAQTRTGSQRYPTFATTTKLRMECTRYIQRWTTRPYELYIINISGFWYASSLISKWNKRDTFFFAFSLSLSLLCLCRISSISFCLFLYLVFVIFVSSWQQRLLS